MTSIVSVDKQKLVACMVQMPTANTINFVTQGKEQTSICNKITHVIARYADLNITAMTTVRLGGTDSEASTFLGVTNASGDSKSLQKLMNFVQENPYLDPGGKPVIADVTGKLTVLAPDRTQLLKDITSILAKNGINIQTLKNRTYPEIDVFDSICVSRDATQADDSFIRTGDFFDCTGVTSVTTMSLEAAHGAIKEAMKELKHLDGAVSTWKETRKGR